MNYQFFRDILDLGLTIVGIIFFVITFVVLYSVLYMIYSLIVPQKIKHLKISEVSPLVFYVPVSIILSVITLIEIFYHDMNLGEVVSAIIPWGDFDEFTDLMQDSNSDFLINTISSTILYKIIENFLYILPSLFFTMLSSVVMRWFCSSGKHKFLTSLFSLICVVFINIYTECNSSKLFDFTISWVYSVDTSSFMNFASSIQSILKAILIVAVLMWAIGDFFASDNLLAMFAFSTAYVVVGENLSYYLSALYILLALCVGLISKQIRSRLVTEDDSFDNYMEYTKENIIYSVIYIVVVIMLACGYLRLAGV